MLGTLLAIGQSGCSIVAGEHDAETKFLVKPNPLSNFAGWSEISLSQDPHSVDSAELMYIQLSTEDSSVSDLTFIKNIFAETKVGEALTKVAQKTQMPSGEQIVPLDRVYDGDLRQFFYKDDKNGGYTVHIAWHGAVDPAHPIPPQGVWMKVKLAVRVD